MEQKELKQLVCYDPETGAFDWLPTSRGLGRNTTANTYRVNINKKHYTLSRIAWLYHYGYMPKGKVLHRNKTKNDYRISNLYTIEYDPYITEEKYFEEIDNAPVPRKTLNLLVRNVAIRRDIKTNKYQVYCHNRHSRKPYIKPCKSYEHAKAVCNFIRRNAPLITNKL